MRSLLVVAVLLVTVPAVLGQDLCTFTANVNISAADIAPAKFVVSAADCCSHCWSMPSCEAAIYSNYFCHLKGTTGPQQVGMGTTLILMQRPTSATPNPPPPPPPPTTAAPVTPQPPTSAPTTAAPSGTVTIIREVSCEYSSTCDRRQDGTCTTAVYFDNVCEDKYVRDCQTHAIEVTKYTNADCTGAKLISAEDLNVCKMTPDETYVGHYCDVQPLPTSGLTLVRTICPYGCDDGSECQTNKFTTGACTPNPFQNLAGQSVIAACFPQYVVYSAYGSLDCSGTPSASRAEPVGTQCFLDQNEEHIQNVCG